MQSGETEDRQAPWQIPWVIEWTQYLLNSHARWVGRELIRRDGTPSDQAVTLFQSPFVVASHGLQEDPVLNYGNQQALDLWEMDWRQFPQTPSRLTAEPVNREERGRMLEQARKHGYLSDYRGVRISRTGKRFLVERATVWNIHNPDGTPLGQGATFPTWTWL
jgi:hypothetical protein